VLEAQSGLLSNKVDYGVLKQLEEKFEKKVAAIERDLKIKGRKLATLMREIGDGSSQNN